jgi:hypothetical protein
MQTLQAVGRCSKLIGTAPVPHPYLPQGLIDPKAMARLALGEALTNLVMARITSLGDVKASGGWLGERRAAALPWIEGWPLALVWL